MPDALILTLQLDEASFRHFNAQRTEFFPAHRNYLPAHVTLFHHLPAEHEDRIAADLTEAVSTQSPFELTVDRVRFLGRGVAYALGSLELQELHTALAHHWHPWLTPQDRQPYRAHITVQNKVPPEEARALFEQLSASFCPRTITACGLLLWLYRGGPWDLLHTFSFPSEPR